MSQKTQETVPAMTADVADPSANTHDPGTQAPFDVAHRAKRNELYASSPGSWMTKLENFAKYVPRQSLARFMARYEIFKLIEHVQGSIVECGVQYGGGLMSFANISTICEPYNFQRRIIGFDSFTGFPSIAEADTAGDANRKSRHLKVGGFAAPEAHDDLLDWIELYDENRYLNHFPKVELVAGDFSVTCPRFMKDNAHIVLSCLYLDFDIYTPTKLALETFLPRIPRGGVIVFDELNEAVFPGETVAALELDLIRNLKIRRFPFEPRISYAVVGE
jgi:hypothetical protein